MSETTVNICGIPHSITVVPDGRMVPHNNDHGGDNWGQIHFGEHSIRLAASNPERMLRSLLHEIIHGIVNELGVRELRGSDGDDLEEPIDQLAFGLAGALESMGFDVQGVLPR